LNTLSWSRALAWRLHRQMLDRLEHSSVEAVVARLTAVAAQAEFAAELSVNTRRLGSKSGDVADALSDGRLIKTFAFRGATHLMNPEDAGNYLALRAASKMWELPSWQSYYDLRPSDWPSFRAAVREALADGPLTREELGKAVTAHARFRHLAFAFADQAWTLMKPLMWQGDMCFESTVEGRTRLQLLSANPRWQGIPDLEEAGPRAVEAYFAAYGPATPKHLYYWLGEGLGAGRKRITAWIEQLKPTLADVDVDGEPALIRREDLDNLLASGDTPVVRLLPAHDQWVMGPGTADTHVTPPGHRALVTRGANVVIAAGVVSGTWSLRDDRVAANWFAPPSAPQRRALAEEIGRLGQILSRDLELE
jgi:hypothetical protein